MDIHSQILPFKNPFILFYLRIRIGKGFVSPRFKDVQLSSVWLQFANMPIISDLFIELDQTICLHEISSVT